MPREIPDVPKGWKPPQPNSGCSYEIKLITPLFGGGVSTQVNDPSFPIRPTTIRGQLQFWWRATVGAQYETPQKLREAQSKVWGDTKQASRVQVRVDNVKATEPTPCARYETDRHHPARFRSMPTWNNPFFNTALPYALFPFQGQLANGRKQIEIEPARCIHHATFRLTVSAHKDIDFARQVEPALWAWLNFGGLGSRTRRGCGAIRCIGTHPSNLPHLTPKDLDDLAAMWSRYAPAGHLGRDWPTLPSHFLCHPHTGSPIDQWNKVIGLLKDFRQKSGNAPGHPRPPGPARSWYPEPDTIRRITRNFSAGHDPSSHLSGGSPLPDGFPRAEFGLPIVFKFKDDQAGDPRRTVLHPYVGGNEEDRGTPEAPDVYVLGGEIKERMASPLVLKPLAIESGDALAIILFLRARLVDQVALLDEKGNDLTPRHRLPACDPSFGSYPDSPLRSLTTRGSAIGAFLELAAMPAGTHNTHRNTGFRRVP